LPVATEAEGHRPRGRLYGRVQTVGDGALGRYRPHATQLRASRAS
jgi:hypothetical protein